MRDSGVVEVVTDLAILCLAIHESAILAIDGPKMKSSTRLDSSILNVVGLLDPMCLIALSASSLEYEVVLCLVLVEC